MIRVLYSPRLRFGRHESTAKLPVWAGRGEPSEAPPPPPGTARQPFEEAPPP